MSDHPNPLPTKEELAEENKKIIEGLEDLPTPEEEQEAIDKADEEKQKALDAKAHEEEDDGEDEEVIEEDTPAPVVVPEKEAPKPDNRPEVQKLAEDNKKMYGALHEANNLPEPTDDELRAAFKDWDSMDDTTRMLSTEALINKRFRDAVNKAAAETSKVDEWNKKVEDYAEDPATLQKIPELEGKSESFITYAQDKSRRGTAFDLLVSAFLFDESKKVKPANKGAMFEQGSGGSHEKGDNKNAGKLSLAESAKLRDANYQKYLELLRAGKISNEVD
jgi:hypothetical protein